MMDTDFEQDEYEGYQKWKSQKGELFIEDYEYQESISPAILLKDEQDFDNFLNVKLEEISKEENEKALQAFLTACEKDECYEYCGKILTKIKSNEKRT